MLVTLKGSTEKIDDWSHKLICNIPALYFDEYEYTVAVRSIFLDFFNDDNTRPEDNFIILKTDLVDKSVINPDQSIASFYKKILNRSDYNYIFYEPAILQKYKIQLPSLASTQFIFSTLRVDQLINITYTEIILEITRYARI